MSKKKRSDQYREALTPSPRKARNNSAQVYPDEVVEFSPYTPNQELAHNAWLEGQNLILTGSAGTGKTFMALHFALTEMLANPQKYHHVLIIRSLVPTRDSGALPGTKEEKEEPYTRIYKSLCDQIFETKNAYPKLESANKLRFDTTSYIRGETFDNCIIVVDEMQNMNFHELDSVITRVGEDCRIIFAGDYRQSDFRYNDEKKGIKKFIQIIEQMRFYDVVKFEWKDIVRSDQVRDYIMTKEYIEDEREEKFND